MSTTLGVQFTLWNDNTGERIEVGDDRDGLDMLEIRFFEDVKAAKPIEIRIGDDQIPHLVNALERFMAFKAEQNRK